MAVQTSLVLSKHICIQMHTHACVQILRSWPCFQHPTRPASCRDPASARLCCRAGATSCWHPWERRRLLHLLPGRGKPDAAGECRLARARVSRHRGRTVPKPRLLNINYLLPALLRTRVTHQTGSRAGSPAVGLMSNWTSSPEALIDSKTSFIETSVQINLMIFGRGGLKISLILSAKQSTKDDLFASGISGLVPKYAWLKSLQVALFRCERKNKSFRALHSKFLALSTHETGCLRGDNVFFVPSKVCEQCLPG